MTCPHAAGLTGQENAALGVLAHRLRSTLGPVVQEIALFGSKSRGDAGPESDIDVLVLLDSTDWRLKRRVCEVAVAVGLETDVFFAVLPMLANDFERSRAARASFALNVEEEGVPV